MVLVKPEWLGWLRFRNCLLPVLLLLKLHQPLRMMGKQQVMILLRENTCGVGYTCNLCGSLNDCLIA